jgi:hypothetical protein
MNGAAPLAGLAMTIWRAERTQLTVSCGWLVALTNLATVDADPVK